MPLIVIKDVNDDSVNAKTDKAKTRIAIIVISSLITNIITEIFVSSMILRISFLSIIIVGAMIYFGIRYGKFIYLLYTSTLFLVLIFSLYPIFATKQFYLLLSSAVVGLTVQLSSLIPGLYLLLFDKEINYYFGIMRLKRKL